MEGKINGLSPGASEVRNSSDGQVESQGQTRGELSQQTTASYHAHGRNATRHLQWAIPQDPAYGKCVRPHELGRGLRNHSFWLDERGKSVIRSNPLRGPPDPICTIYGLLYTTFGFRCAPLIMALPIVEAVGLPQPQELQAANTLLRTSSRSSISKLSFSCRLFKDACCPLSVLAPFPLIVDGDKLQTSRHWP